MKVCSKCGEKKPLECYYIRSTNKKPRSECKQCHSEYRKRLYEQTKEETYQSVRRNRLKRLYGLSEEGFAAMLEAQNGLCKICGVEVIVRNSGHLSNDSACVDHCHRTGVVRGILCHKHNTLLSRANDSIQILEQAITYLRGE